MAEEQECVPVNIGEVVPIIFEVYTESGTPFTVLPGGATCIVKTTGGSKVASITAKIISDEAADKKFIVSWDTSGLSSAYYLLQVWCRINITGDVTKDGDLITEAFIASDELKRFLH